MNEKNLKMIIASLIVVLIVSISYMSLLILDNNFYNQQNKILSQKEALFSEYKNEYKNLITPRNDSLRNPFYNETICLIEEFSSNYPNLTISNIKKTGIRCALSQIIIKNEYMYEIIAFETIDKGLSFFEVKTGYRVFPELGKEYWSCVYYLNNESHPYSKIDIDERIQDIILIW